MQYFFIFKNAASKPSNFWCNALDLNVSTKTVWYTYTDTTSDYLSADDDDRSDPGLSTSDPRYVGNKIPSKTFLKLHRSMERRSAEPERDDYSYGMHDNDNLKSLCRGVFVVC